MSRRLVLDLEANNLLNNDSIDYTSTPYKLKDTFKIWCVCCIDMDTREEFIFINDEVKTELPKLLKEASQITAHNAIDYDLLVLQMYLGLNFSVEEYPKEEYPDLFDGRKILIEDTLVLSRTQNPDRYGGHSLDSWGIRLSNNKIDWRAEAISLGVIEKDSPKGAEFQQFHPRLVEYCVQDCRVTLELSNYLRRERGDWDWADAISLEKSTAQIVTIGAHRGFKFNSDLAIEAIKELDGFLNDIKTKVEPILPMKPLPKTRQKDFTPPKKQFLKNGEIREQTIAWIERNGGKIWEEEGKWKAHLFDNDYTLPLPDEPLITFEKAKLTDSTFIKSWLITEGWNPINWKERDLTSNQKKQKLSREKYEEAVERYVNNTLGTAYEKERCEHLQCTPDTLKRVLLAHDLTKPKKVLTSPTYTQGADKELCPSLLALQDKFPYAKDVVDFLTFTHRRNSILGSGMTLEDFEDEEGEEPHKGFLAYIKADGRIPTEANSCGAASRRFLHRKVTNIPRSTSLYGEKMRAMFGVDEHFYQLGYDFDSLEAVITACLVYKYEGGIEFGNILRAEKPNDVHTVFASKLSALLGRPFPRGTAKSAVYGMTYNAQIPRVAKIAGCDLALAKIVYDSYWEFASPLKQAKEELQKYWETTGGKKFILGLDGGKIPIRTKGNVVNSWCQSAGVICAKRAAIILEKKMKKEGFYVNPFTNNVQDGLKALSLCMYHDEQQLEVNKKLVSFKSFATKEEAVNFKTEYENNNNRKLSDIGHTNNKYYTAYCRVGELAVEAVKEAGEYYSLPLQLTSGYTIGRNWRECH